MAEPLSDPGDGGGGGSQLACDLCVRVTSVDQSGNLETLSQRRKLVKRADVAEEGEHLLLIVDLRQCGCELLEHGSAGIELLTELGFGACRLVLAVPNASAITTKEQLAGARIATSHPNVLAGYLDANGIAASVVTLSGSIELAPTIGAADAICDLVSTGETLRQNSLRAIGEVLRSQAVLLARTQVTPDPRIAVLQTAVESVLAARPKRYLMLNAPDVALEAIIALLPGLDAPTILPLARSDMHAVHAVVDAAELPRLLHPLKEAGASGLLVLPIEHLIP